MRLKMQMLDTPEFHDFARDKLILLELDFPHHKDQPADEKKQNTELSDNQGTDIGKIDKAWNHPNIQYWTCLVLGSSPISFRPTVRSCATAKFWLDFHSPNSLP